MMKWLRALSLGSNCVLNLSSTIRWLACSFTFCGMCFSPQWNGNINAWWKGLLSGCCKDCWHRGVWSLPHVVTTAIVNLCPYLQEDLRFCLEAGLPGRMAEVTIGLTKASKPGPGEIPMVGSPWHFSFLPSDIGPTVQNSIWTKRTPGDFSQQGDSSTNDRAGRSGF